MSDEGKDEFSERLSDAQRQIPEVASFPTDSSLPFIPGLPKESMPILHLIIERAVQDGVRKAFREESNTPCRRKCDRVEMVQEASSQHELTLYGEAGRNGLTRDVEVLKQQMRLLMWLTGTAVTALVGAVITLAFTLY